MLLLALCVSTFFYYAYLGIVEAEVKTIAHFSIEKKDNPELEIIKIPAQKFNKHEDEIWHNGHLYDIASYRQVQDTVYVSVLHDKNEECLIDMIREKFASTSDSYVDNSSGHISAKHKYVLIEVKCFFSSMFKSSEYPQWQKRNYRFVERDYFNRSISIASPPPKTTSCC